MQEIAKFYDAFDIRQLLIQGGVNPSLPPEYYFSLFSRIRKAKEYHATEIHVVGGFNPYLPMEYYETIFKAIKEGISEDRYTWPVNIRNIVHSKKGKTECERSSDRAQEERP